MKSKLQNLYIYCIECLINQSNVTMLILVTAYQGYKRSIKRRAGSQDLLILLESR